MTATRRIGRDGPQVSAIGLGCMGMSFAYGQGDDEGSAATLRRALDLGVTHFDTADMYGFGHNEELIGRVIGDRRDEYVLATKFANRGEVDAQGEVRRRWVDSSAAWARQALELAGLIGVSCQDLRSGTEFRHETPIMARRRGVSRPRTRCR